jgi:hypothetical protein
LKSHFGNVLSASGAGDMAATSVAEPMSLDRIQAESGLRTTALDISPARPAAKPASDPSLRVENLRTAARQDLLREAWLVARSDENCQYDDWMDYLRSYEAAPNEQPSDVASAVDAAFAILGVVVEE